MSTPINFDMLIYEWFQKDGEQRMFSTAEAIERHYNEGWRPVYAKVEVSTCAATQNDNGIEKNRRKKDGTFAKGYSGNPAGRPGKYVKLRVKRLRGHS